MIQNWNWRQWLPTWLGGEAPPKPIPQTFIEFLRENKSMLGLVLQSTSDEATTYYRTGAGGSDFSFIVKPAESDQKNTEIQISIPTSDRRKQAAQQLKQPYNRYLATEFPSERESWPTVELKD